jgi:two-component system response regulator AlgR
MKILIVDDEQPARDRLRRLLGEDGECEVIGEAGDGRAALEACESLNPDVVLMDIRMPGMDGVEAARHLARLDTPPAVIFTTAYSEYAMDAFEARAVGYLVKPVRRERLLDAVRHARRPTLAQLRALNSDGTDTAPARTHICAKVKDSLRLIPVDDVLCFQADQKYVVVRTRDSEILIDESLRELEDEFAASFVRIHRNALVAVAYLAALEKNSEGQWFACLRGSDRALGVSRRHLRTVRQCIADGITNKNESR